MEPLRQWICDTCGEVIKRPEDGYLEWIHPEDSGAMEFHIVHIPPASPYYEGGRGGRNCYQHTKHRYRRDLPLPSFLGPLGLVRLLAFLDAGEIVDPEGTREMRVGNMRSFVEIFRRLHLPNYEEARLYYSNAEERGYFDGANELTAYLPNTLTDIIDEFAPARG